MRHYCTSIEISDLTGCKTVTYSISTSVVQKECPISNKNVVSSKHFFHNLKLIDVKMDVRKKCLIANIQTICYLIGRLEYNTNNNNNI